MVTLIVDADKIDVRGIATVGMLSAPLKQLLPSTKSLKNVKGIKGDALKQADALIMFSCVRRYQSFGMVIKKEIKQVQQIWDAPMVVFFTYGDYKKFKKVKNDFHNNACCLVALKGKQLQAI